ncbi:MAG: helix-turn-helix domain-containing protein, partial [Oligoflexia bacterium]|nr:helix-turn-helix domain-containing protein [Oligoflexia bacterium]
RQTFYKWVRRYKKQGEIGLSDKSKRPHNSPRSTPSDIVSKILYLRKNYYFGPEKISNYMMRYHRIQVAQSSVHRILQRHNLNRLPNNRRKYERQKTK